MVQQSQLAFKLLQKQCGESIPPEEDRPTIRTNIVDEARTQIDQHYLWGTEGEQPGLGDVVLDSIYQGVAKVANGCICAGKHSHPSVACLPRMSYCVLDSDVESYCGTHSFLRLEGKDNCGGGCGVSEGDEIWGECCIGRRHFDCSGFVFWCYNQAGYNIGRRTVSGYQGCDTDIEKESLEPGDLCYIGSSHVGIYAGCDKVIEARAHNWGVVESSLNNRWQTFGSLFLQKS